MKCWLTFISQTADVKAEARRLRAQLPLPPGVTFEVADGPLDGPIDLGKDPLLDWDPESEEGMRWHELVWLLEPTALVDMGVYGKASVQWWRDHPETERQLTVRLRALTHTLDIYDAVNGQLVGWVEKPLSRQQ